MECKPESIIGKAGTGAVLSLDAIGLQDTYLTSNVGDSFFQFKNIQHTQFTKYSASIQLNNDGSTNWPFNQKIMFNLHPKEMGDILQNMYLKCTLPPLPLGGGQYSNDVGLTMINQIQLNADDVVLEIIKTDWNVMYTELYYTQEEIEIYYAITKTFIFIHLVRTWKFIL
jgi:Major capsid protein N-terminus